MLYYCSFHCQPIRQGEGQNLCLSPRICQQSTELSSFLSAVEAQDLPAEGTLKAGMHFLLLQRQEDFHIFLNTSRLLIQTLNHSPERLNGEKTLLSLEMSSGQRPRTEPGLCARLLLISSETARVGLKCMTVNAGKGQQCKDVQSTVAADNPVEKHS